MSEKCAPNHKCPRCGPIWPCAEHATTRESKHICKLNEHIGELEAQAAKDNAANKRQADWIHKAEAELVEKARRIRDLESYNARLRAMDGNTLVRELERDFEAVRSDQAAWIRKYNEARAELAKVQIDLGLKEEGRLYLLAQYKKQEAELAQVKIDYNKVAAEWSQVEAELARVRAVVEGIIESHRYTAKTPNLYPFIAQALNRRAEALEAALEGKASCVCGQCGQDDCTCDTDEADIKAAIAAAGKRKENDNAKDQRNL